MLDTADLGDPRVMTAACAAVGLLVGAGGYAAWRSRKSPAERERRRRLQVNGEGRITHGTIVDYDPTPTEGGGLIHYTYTIAGVEYAAAQDVSTLAEQIGDDLSRVVGTVSVKYLVRNPSNSIVLCESWCGLRPPKAKLD